MIILYIAIVVFILCATLAWIGNKIDPDSKPSGDSLVEDEDSSYMIERFSAGYTGLFED